MGLSRFCGARGWCLRARQYLLSPDPPDAMPLEQPLHLFLTQQRGVGRGRGEIDPVPQLGLIAALRARGSPIRASFYSISTLLKWYRAQGAGGS
jgi:hypothetical protein